MAYTDEVWEGVRRIQVRIDRGNAALHKLPVADQNLFHVDHDLTDIQAAGDAIDVALQKLSHEEQADLLQWWMYDDARGSPDVFHTRCQLMRSKGIQNAAARLVHIMYERSKL